MPPLVRDYVEFQKIPHLPEASLTRASECLQTFHPTDALIELISRILEVIYQKLRDPGTISQEPVSILLTGGNGVGKTHLLGVLCSLISQKSPLSRGLSDPRIQSTISALREVAPLTISIDLSQETDQPLAELVLSKVHTEFENRFGRQVIDPSTIPGIDTIKAHELITFNIASEKPILLVIDGLSQRAQHRDVQQLNEDIEFLSFMGYSSRSARLFLLVAAHEDFFSPKSPLGIDSTLMAQTLENFKIDWIDRASLREVLVRHALRKTPRQQLDLNKLYSFIKTRLPNFQYSEAEFRETYPFHPLIFDLSERIKSKVPGFSLIDFVLSTFPRVASHRAISIVTVDRVFDKLEYDFKTQPACKRLYAVYQSLVDQAVPRLQDRWRLWGKMLLKSSYLFTLADRAPSVRELADSLLLYEDSESGLSYNVVGMILSQMERAVESGFATTDDRLDRTYRIGVSDLREELNQYLSTVVSQIADDDPRLGEALLIGAQAYFPDWPLRVDATRLVSPQPCWLSLNWKGTERRGACLFSNRIRKRKLSQFDEVEPLSLSQALPQPAPESDSRAESVATGTAGSILSGEEMEWLVLVEPIGLTPDEEASLQPTKPTEVHWVPASPTGEEILQLKTVLALLLTEKSPAAEFSPSEVHSLREEMNLDMSNLFRELYLIRGRVVTSSQVQAFNQGHLACQNFLSFLAYLLRPNLSSLYPHHPDFGNEPLSESQTMLLAHKLFAGLDPTHSLVQSLAGRFALPLGLVSRTDDLYELNLTITPPIFLTRVLEYLETLEAAETPTEEIYQRVHIPPFGLNRASLHLMLAALVADGHIELSDPASNTTISRENLTSMERISAFPCFKRIPTHKDFPIEVLTHWCRLISGKHDLSDISTSRGRAAALAGMSEWLNQWNALAVSRKVDALPNEFLTNQMWRNLAWTRRRFEKMSEIVQSVLDSEVSLIQGMAKIIDLFGENIALLEKASRDLVELSHFIHWLDRYLEARGYLLASAKAAGDEELEELRTNLLSLLDTPHLLINTDKRNEFESLYQKFKTQYIDHYAKRHDESVGPMGHFKLLAAIESSQELRNLQLLSSLPMGDPSYVQQIDEWILTFRDYQCSLPVRDLLRDKPHCGCHFQLSHPFDVAAVAEDLQEFLRLGISHHRQIVEYFRHVIEPRLEGEAGNAVTHGDAIRVLLSDAPIQELNQEIMDELNSLLDSHILEEEIASPLPILAPAGRITKKQLEAKMKEWLESLSNEEDLLFSLKGGSF
ncbi:MAG: DUF6079 family protein [Acidobacteriota bacterium]